MDFLMGEVSGATIPLSLKYQLLPNVNVPPCKHRVIALLYILGYD